MQRTLQVSTDVYAAIWANRQSGEDTEDAILRRLLNCPSPVPNGTHGKQNSSGGLRDIRNGVDFPEGFRIFRHYKRREFTAEARGGSWVRLDNGQSYPTLNQLNGSIAAGAENVWNGNWKYRASDGSIRSIGELRR